MGNTRYYTKDNGQSFAELEYDVWGAITSPSKLTNNDNGNFAAAVFTGHPYDTVLDVYFAEARFYDAKYRQWMASDPIKDGLNWYLYANGNPATFFDPDGREPVKIGEADSPWIETGNFFMNDQYIRTKVSKETGTVYGNLYDMVHSVGGTTWASAKDPFRGKDITHFYAVTETAKFVYKNSTLEYHRKEPYSVIFSDFLDSGNGTRDGDVFVPMDYFAKLMCNTIGVDKPIWGQKLILPQNPEDKQIKITAGFQEEAPNYYTEIDDKGHFGIDFGVMGGLELYAMGIGYVIRNQWNRYLGNVLDVRYDNVLNTDGKNIGSIVVSYNHLKESATVKVGDKISIESGQIATIGNTGEWNMQPHLHLETIPYYNDVDRNNPHTIYPSSSLGYYQKNLLEGNFTPFEVLFRAEDISVIGGSGDEENNGWYIVGDVYNMPSVKRPNG